MWFLFALLFAAEPVAKPVVETPGYRAIPVQLPPGVAIDTVKVEGVKHKVEVLNRWNDGSVRMATIAAVWPVGVVNVFAVPEPLPPKPPIDPNKATAVFTFAGQEYRLAVDVDGKRTFTKPTDANGNAHAFLTCWIDTVNEFGFQSARVTPEHCIDIAGAEVPLTYDVSIHFGGKVLFEQKNVTHFWATRWTKRFVLAGQEATVTPDFESMIKAGAWERFDLTVPVVYDKAIGAGPEWGILGRGELTVGPANMTDHGGFPRMALRPSWEASYSVHKRPNQLAFILKMAELSASWPMHVRDAETLEIVSVEDNPDYWLDGRSNKVKANIPDGRPRVTKEFVDKGYPNQADVAHAPSFCYLAWLLTADPFFADEMSFWANHALIGSGLVEGQFSRAVHVIPGDFEPRGMAYGLRNVTDCSWLPNSPYRQYFARQTEKTLLAWDKVSESHNSPLGSIYELKADWDNTLMVVKPWQFGPLAWAIDRAQRYGFQGGEHMKDRLLRFNVTMANHHSWGGSDPRRSTLYNMLVGVRTKDATGNWQYNWFPDWQSAALENARPLPFNNRVSGFFSGDWLAGGPASGDYTGGAWVGLVTAKRRGLAGAAEAVERVRGLTGSSQAGWRVASEF